MKTIPCCTHNANGFSCRCEVQKREISTLEENEKLRAENERLKDGKMLVFYAKLLRFRGGK